MNPRTAGYEWADGLLPGQPIFEEDIRAAFAAYGGNLSDADYAAFRAGALDFGAARQEKRALFLISKRPLKPLEIAKALGLSARNIRSHIARGKLSAQRRGKLYFVQAADYAAWWRKRNRYR